ncbi:hypothetical protein QTP70_009786 [Hemibagrus guttatus]|uniref:Uncharacterized protein n=1 Tax=Hemibagrus guttatus TaxID=175788 RepID=A0AAE0Q3X9_9TELE|nr:hypothetical protein QTP70_009786 [Hemibagrus guttatus]
MAVGSENTFYALSQSGEIPEALPMHPTGRGGGKQAISRVLKPGGRFVSVTFAQPHFRKKLYARQEYSWSINHYHYGDSFHYFLYVLTKGEELSPEDVALERKVLSQMEDQPTVVTYQEVENEDFLNNIGL